MHFWKSYQGQIVVLWLRGAFIRCHFTACWYLLKCTIYIAFLPPAFSLCGSHRYELLKDRKVALYWDPSKGYLPFFQVTTGIGLEIVIIDLLPYTTYSVFVRACTSVGCSIGPATIAMTTAGIPSDMASPTVHNVTTESAILVWEEPANTNGPLTE